MTCREFENLLGKPLSAEAQDHLRTCESCRALAQWFDAPASETPVLPAIPLHDLKPVRPLPSPWWIAAGLLAIAGIIVAVGSKHLGIAGWDALDSTQKIAVFSGLGIVGATTSILLARQMFPTLSRWFSPAICIAAALAAIVAGPIALMPLEFDPDGFAETGMGCAKYGLMYAVAVLGLTWLVIRRGYFLRPAWSGALAGLGAGTAAVMVLQVYCPLIERSHVLAWHASIAVASVAASTIVAYLISKQRS